MAYLKNNKHDFCMCFRIQLVQKYLTSILSILVIMYL